MECPFGLDVFKASHLIKWLKANSGQIIRIKFIDQTFCEERRSIKKALNKQLMPFKSLGISKSSAIKIADLGIRENNIRIVAPGTELRVIDGEQYWGSGGFSARCVTNCKDISTAHWNNGFAVGEEKIYKLEKTGDFVAEVKYSFSSDFVRVTICQ